MEYFKTLLQLQNIDWYLLLLLFLLFKPIYSPLNIFRYTRSAQAEWDGRIRFERNRQSPLSPVHRWSSVNEPKANPEISAGHRED